MISANEDFILINRIKPCEMSLYTKFTTFQVDPEAAKELMSSRIPIVLIPSSLSCSVSLTSYLTTREGTNGLFSAIFDCNDHLLFNASKKVRTFTMSCHFKLRSLWPMISSVHTCPFHISKTQNCI